MIHHKQKIHSSIRIVVSVLFLFTLLACSMVYAEEIPLNYSGNYDNWDPDNSPTVGSGTFPPIVIEIKDGASSRITQSSGVSRKIWVTISPFTATLSGQVTKMVAGYLSGDRTGATITIAGKRPSDLEFSDITTIKPDENGLFIWAVPTGQKDVVLFRVTARSGSTQVQSNEIRFTTDGGDLIVQPVIAPVSTLIHAQTPTPVLMVPGGSSLPAMTQLTISTRTTTPAVGETLIITGRLTDQDGKGVDGATITIDETGYPGAVQSEPFATTHSGSDGRFEFSLGVSFADSVGLVANYEGDESHNPAESNTLFFTAHQA